MKAMRKETAGPSGLQDCRGRKTTLAQELIKLIKITGKPVIHLDGDKLREIFGVVERNSQNYDRNARLRLAMNILN